MYKIRYGSRVSEKDACKIPKSDLKTIYQQINKKLTVAPDKYGKTLSGKLKGFRRLRINHYRIVYRIEKQKIEVLVIHIGHRRNNEVYLETLTRI